MSDAPTFFAGRRLSVYCKGGRLGKNKKTDQRFWRLKLALTLRDADAYTCRGAILSNYQQIGARENNCGRIEMDGELGGKIVSFYAIEDEKAPRLLQLSGCFLDRFAMTWADGMTEFWLQLEHPNTDALHKFVKDYAFTRFYVEFLPAQRSLTEVIESAEQEAIDPLAPGWTLSAVRHKLTKSKIEPKPN